MSSVKALMTKIDSTHLKIKERSNLISEQIRINKDLEYKCRKVSTKTKFIKYRVNLSSFKVIEFKIGEFWLETLLEYKEEKLLFLNNRLQSLKKYTRKLCSIIQSHGSSPSLIGNDTGKCVKIVQKKSCVCNKLIVSCWRHSSSITHKKFYVHPDEGKIASDGVLAIDCECVRDNNKKVAVRIAIVHAFKDKNIELIHHSLWRPECFLQSKDLIFSGFKLSDFNNCKDDFIDRDVGRNALKSILHKRTIVFAGMAGDIMSLGIDNSLNGRDIQNFYCRFPNRPKGQEPVNLRWLSRNILNREIQEKEHCPIVDASCTLLLYFLIPKTFWDKNSILDITPKLTATITIAGCESDTYESDDDW